ncbi:glycosyltransferase [Paenibacillus sp. NPDC058071]|uniref:glycosyltransferase n=1 Tax=Paenibacillus sp. NPDC058071 TaxID=3346326 RepID=UPI0036DDAA02
MKHKWLLALLVTVAVVSNVNPAEASMQAKVMENGGPVCVSPKVVQLKSELEKAWIDHTIWTRNYIVSALSDSQDQKYVLNRLLQNQQDIGNAIKPYYGEAAGNKLAELLKEHIVLAGKIIEAAKTNNQADVKKFEADWHKNADEIAKFLSDANPNWSFKELQDMLYAHLQYITDIVLARLKGDWQASIDTTDKNEVHMIHFADILTEGIVKQFPNQF